MTPAGRTRWLSRRAAVGKASAAEDVKSLCPLQAFQDVLPLVVVFLLGDQAFVLEAFEQSEPLLDILIVRVALRRRAGRSARCNARCGRGARRRRCLDGVFGDLNPIAPVT